MRIRSRWLLPIALAAAVCHSQSGPVFDVASLKPSPPATGDTININLGSIRNGDVTLSNASLVDCIKFAYGLVSNEQVAGPDWTKSKAVRFDILAKAAPSTPRELLLLMLRTLLNERFHLAMHTEHRSFAHYALVTGKSGLKMHEVQPEPAASKMTYRIGSIVHNQISMQTLALLLSRQLGELVLDETRLAGAYEMKLEWTPETSRNTPDPPEHGPSIFTAVQEQLGLKLEARRDAVEVLVIDRADQVPVEN
ncbi:MAG TPA: TIGR03435 family protein [Bryobacteraceae bacterium]|nr:TIGR03435 family protein [Bryobacteraceae bacterium]